jgi:hypothetical protein
MHNPPFGNSEKMGVVIRSAAAAQFYFSNTSSVDVAEA